MFQTLWAIWYLLCNLKNTHEEVLFLGVLLLFFTKSNTAPWVFFTFFKIVLMVPKHHILFLHFSINKFRRAKQTLFILIFPENYSWFINDLISKILYGMLWNRLTIEKVFLYIFTSCLFFRKSSPSGLLIKKVGCCGWLFLIGVHRRCHVNIWWYSIRGSRTSSTI